MRQVGPDDIRLDAADRQAAPRGQPALLKLPRALVERLAAKAGVGPEVAWETIWSFLLRATNTGLGFFVTVLLARMLGVEGYGIYAYVYAWVRLLAMPAQSGLPPLIMRETARGLAAEEPERVKGAWYWAGRVVTALSLLIILGIGPLLIAWMGGLGALKGQTMAWALVLVPLIALGNLRDGALRGLGRIVAGQVAELTIRPGLFLLLLAGGALVLQRLSAPMAMSFHALASLVAFLVGAWWLGKWTPATVRRAQPRVESKGWLLSSLIFALLSGFSVVNNQASTIVLGIFGQPEQVGVFRVAVRVAALASFGLQTVNMVVAPRFARLYTSGDTARLQRVVTGSARVVLASNMLLTVFFAALGRSFFHWIFGAEFVASYTPLLILLVGQVINSLAGSVGYLLNMTGHERDTAMGMGIGVVINLILNLVLVPRWGVEGTATATAVSMALWNGLLWWRVRRRLGINSLAFNLAKRG